MAHGECMLAIANVLRLLYFMSPPLGGSGSIISVGDYADNSFTAFGSSDHREVILKL